MISEATLHVIRDRLDAGTTPTDLIEEMLPRTTDEAVTWARRLTGWEDHSFPKRVVALARIISRRAMQEHGLRITEDGRVTPLSVPSPPDPTPTRIFSLTIAGEDVRVEYTRDYFPRIATDHFQFRSPHDPVRPIPMSGTGWWSQMVHHDIVEACGGPKLYAELLAQAEVEGRTNDLEAAFVGLRPAEKREAKKKPVVGKHTGEVVAERVETPVQVKPPGALF
jgi:hypothetical protein